ncbi:MAG: hypothetical protein ACRCXT_05365 [Paraclostridium sp.]
MGLKDKFAESFARSKTMTGPEKKANEIMGKLLMKKSIPSIVLIILVWLGGTLLNVNGWAILALEVLIAVGSYFYIKKQSEQYQNFKPFVGNLISLEKKGKKEYVAIIKQGKRIDKLQIKYGGEDLEHVKKNQLVQVSYNKDAQIAIVVTR